MSTGTIFRLVAAGILALCCIVMYHLQILEKEKYLTRMFGAGHTDYMNKTRRYLGMR
jgi:protein-S-isoprenylcysteine O-methyltransferase Ste14